VSLIIPTRNGLDLLRPCIEGLLYRTDYPHLEIIVVDNASDELETLEYLDQISRLGVKVLRYPHAFNFAAINNWAIEQASGELIGLINNDIEVQQPGWLKAMVAQLIRPNVGAVGAKLIWPNGMVQHGGVVVGVAGLAAHAFNDAFQEDAGYLGLNQVPREQSAVTAACLLLRKSDFKAVGGFDTVHFPVAFNDVDLCLKLRALGKKIVWTPDATLIHAESASRGLEDTPSKASRARREQRHFIARWQAHQSCDPYYHPALALDVVSSMYGALSTRPGSNKTRTSLPLLPVGSSTTIEP
jgi:GT2 family glycosyltransferase